MKFLFKLLRRLFWLALALILAAGGLLAFQGYRMYRQALDGQSLEAALSAVRSAPGYTPIDQLPELYLDAVVAVEDHRFEQHSGIDPIAILRAAVQDLRTRSLDQGGSTITQQVAKNLFFTQEKQFARKIAEVFMAFRLEDVYSKDEILELYVNTIYFGDGYYGIHDASAGYFGKEPAQLTPYEATLLEAARICGILLTPFMPESCEKLFAQIGAPAETQTWDAAAEWGALPETAVVTKGENLFPRLDMDKALSELETAEAEAKKAALPAVEVEPQLTEKVDFETFCKSDFRAVKVKACDAVKKSEKLLRFTLDDGTGVDRQILSGIHKWYEPEDLVGKTLIAIVNLPPRKMMGLESNGMLISAVHTEHGEECLHLIMVDDSIPAGAKLC